MRLQRPTGRNIISVVELQQYLNNNDVSLTGFLQTCISSVSTIFENYCDKGLKENEYTEYYDGNNTNILYVSQYPIQSISFLQYQMNPTDSWHDYYTGSATGYIQICDSGKIVLYDQLFYGVNNSDVVSNNNRFIYTANNIKIIYTAGYTNCPFDIKKIAMEACSEMLAESKWGSSRLGLKNTSVSQGNNYTESYYELNNRHMRVLDNYRKVQI